LNELSIIDCRACCADITEDTTMMVAGYGNSSVQVFSLNQDTLKQLKTMEQLEMLDQEAGLFVLVMCY
jgi:hypothetical protein